MKKCLKCGFRTEEEINFCPECGERLARVVFKTKQPEPVVKEAAPVAEVKNPTAPVAEGSVDKTRFNNNFRNALVFEFIGNILLLGLLFFIVFLRMFNANGLAIIVRNGQYELSTRTSFYDVVYVYFKLVKGSGMDSMEFNGTVVYTFIFAIYFAAMALAVFVRLIIQIVKFATLNDYYLEKYHDLTTNKVSRWRAYNATGTISLLISSIIVFAFIYGFDKIPTVGSHLYNGFNGFLAIVVLFAVASLVFLIIAAAIQSSTKKRFLREQQ